MPPAAPLEDVGNRKDDEGEDEQHDGHGAAASASSLSIDLKIQTGATSVSKGMFPEMRTIQPNSPTAFPNESAAQSIAGSRLGGRSAGRS